MNELIGTEFGRWVVLEVIGPRLRCKCSCPSATERTLTKHVLRQGASKSCGCLRRELGVLRGRASATHGKEQTPEYMIWSQMKNRCLNPNAAAYANYGARGIQVCERWRTSFEAFYGDIGPRPPGMRGKRPLYSIGRIDNEGHYEPGNVSWQTPEEQNANTRTSHRLIVNGVPMSTIAACARFGTSRTAFYKRLARGWTEDEALRGRP